MTITFVAAFRIGLMLHQTLRGAALQTWNASQPMKRFYWSAVNRRCPQRNPRTLFGLELQKGV
jgi:hypothetical protein